MGERNTKAPEGLSECCIMLYQYMWYIKENIWMMVIIIIASLKEEHRNIYDDDDVEWAIIQ